MVFLMAMEGHIRPNIGILVVVALSFSRNHLLPILLSQPEYKGKDVGLRSFHYLQTTPDDYKVIMRNGFLAMDAEMRKKQSDNDNDRSGSTAITAFVTPNHIIVANCGIIWRLN